VELVVVQKKDPSIKTKRLTGLAEGIGEQQNQDDKEKGKKKKQYCPLKGQRGKGL